MAKTKFVIFFIIILGLFESLYCGPYISAKNDSLIKKGIRLTIQQSYQEAIVVFEQIETSSPDSPVGYFFHAAVLQTQMMDYENYQNEAEFLRLVRHTIELSQQQAKDEPRNAWAYFFLGGGYGYLAFYQAKQKNLLQAFNSGKQSVNALEKAIQIDPALYDAYLGLGTYYYYRSKFSRYVDWLPLVNNDREQSIKMIKTAMAKSRYSHYSAMNSYCWICIEEEKYQEGLEIATQVLQEFPQSRLFLWCAAKLSKKLKQWRAAANYFEKILFSLTKNKALSPRNEIVCRKNLTQIYLRLGEHRRAEEQCQKVSAMDLGEGDREKFEDDLRSIEKACGDKLLGWNRN